MVTISLLSFSLQFRKAFSLQADVQQSSENLCVGKTKSFGSCPLLGIDELIGGELDMP